ncbi:MAG: hypothetical protein K6B41_00440 [Butyrivibrio sp.]|nr:hypothetical protein [Butyrivibrio sp.]
MTKKNNLYKNLTHAIKIILAAVIATLIAELCGLKFSVSAGIVAILSVAFTKKETIETARNRFIAFIVALIISAVCFYTIGFTNNGFFAYLVIYIIVCQFMGWNSAMAMDSVLISHFLSFENMAFPALMNEILLFIIGVGIGIIANIFLRKDKDYMARMEKETDDLIKYALHRMSLRIINPGLPDYDGTCFVSLRKSLDEASALAHSNFMNQLCNQDVEDIEYISMRKHQSVTLYEIYKHLSKIETVPLTASLLSDFFEKVSLQYSMDNTVEDLLHDFRKLDKKMKDTPLPQERKEFEDRARLFTIMRCLEEFLTIKRDYMREKNKKVNLT